MAPMAIVRSTMYTSGSLYYLAKTTKQKKMDWRASKSIQSRPRIKNKKEKRIGKRQKNIFYLPDTFPYDNAKTMA